MTRFQMARSSYKYPDSLWLSLPLEFGVSVGCAVLSWHLFAIPLKLLKERFTPSGNGQNFSAEVSRPSSLMA
jgi:hypothetical protein